MGPGGSEHGEDTFSPIPVEAEAGGLDPWAVEALESIRRVLSPDGDGDHEDEADAIAERSAFRTSQQSPEMKSATIGWQSSATRPWRI